MLLVLALCGCWLTDGEVLDRIADGLNIPREFVCQTMETDLTPDYFIRETGDWLVFPHELDALEPDELRQERPEIAAIIDAAKESRKTA